MNSQIGSDLSLKQNIPYSIRCCITKNFSQPMSVLHATSVQHWGSSTVTISTESMVLWYLDTSVWMKLWIWIWIFEHSLSITTWWIHHLIWLAAKVVCTISLSMNFNKQQYKKVSIEAGIWRNAIALEMKYKHLRYSHSLAEAVVLHKQFTTALSSCCAYQSNVI